MSRPAPLPPETVRRASGGDSSARRALLDRYGCVVWGVCRTLAPGDAEDCYQAIWEKAFRALPGFDADGRASLSTWLYTIAHNHCVDRHRRRAGRGTVVSLDQLPPVQPVADSRLYAAQRAARLERALARLSEPHRRAVVFHYLEELPVRVIAEQEGVPVGTVKTRLHHARARLLELLTRGVE